MKDPNRNVESSILLLRNGLLTEDTYRDLIQQVRFDAWQEAHDTFCDFGSDCDLARRHGSGNPHAMTPKTSKTSKETR